MKIKNISIYVFYTWLMIFSFIPLVFVIIASFLSPNAKHLASLPWTLHNYFLLFDPTFIKIFCRSLIIALITTLSCLLVAYPFSYILIKSKYQSLLLLLIIIPFWTSSLVRTYALLALLKFKGLFNTLLLQLHIIHTPMALLYTNFAVILGLIYNLFPFMVLPLFSNMERFDFNLIDAAKDLGASTWNIFWRVFLPNTYAGIISGSLLVFLPAMTLFYIPNVLGGARSILLGNLIQNQFLVFDNWPQGSATSVILTFLLLALLMLLRRRNKESIS